MGFAAGQLAHHVHAHCVGCMQGAMFGAPPRIQDSSFAQASRHASEALGCGLSPPLCSTAIRGVSPELQPLQDGKSPCQFSGHNCAQTALFRPSSVPTGAPPPWLQRKVPQDFTPFLAGFQAHLTTSRGRNPCTNRPAWPFGRIPIVRAPSAGPGFRSLESGARPPRPGR